MPVPCAETPPPLYMRVHLRLSRRFLLRFPALPSERLLALVCRTLEIPVEVCTALHVWAEQETFTWHVTLDLTTPEALQHAEGEASHGVSSPA